VSWSSSNSPSDVINGRVSTVWLMSLNIFFRLVKHLLWKLNQTQPTTIYLAVSVSIRGLRQKETKKPFTRSQRLHSLSEQHKSALTDHASRDNHLINWSQATILDRESDRGTRWITEAVHIQKEGRSSMNRDEGSYILSHTYDRFLTTSHHYRGKNRKKN